MSILIVVSNENEVPALMRWGHHFAQARSTDLVVLHPKRAENAGKPKDLSFLEGADSEDNNPMVDAMIKTARELIGDVEVASPVDGEDSQKDAQASAIFLRIVAHHDQVKAVLSEVDRSKTSLLVIAKHERIKGEASDETLVRRLFSKASCDTMLIRLGHSDGKSFDRILVPAAGGPNAKVALKLSEQMIHLNEGRLTALFVEPELGEDARAVGKQLIRRAMDAADVEPSNRIRPKVVLADDVRVGIAEEAEASEERDEGYDLMIVGSSNVGFMRRILFGTLPDSLLEGKSPMAVSVIRKSRPLFARIREGVEHWLDLTVPQLARKDRIDLFARIESGSHWGFDFMALMCLATAIASLGLIKDSSAVVIGAMLVAPLMTPLIGVGLALVQGNLLLLKSASKAVAYGFLLALAIGFLVGEVTPMHALTPELLARGGPDLLDLAIAFLSGVAAAYAMGRPTLLAALPGVAIAAALVPPLATIGISLALGETKNAGGSAMLFGTNVAAIVLGAAFSLYAGGVRGNRQQERKRAWVRRSILGLVLVTGLLAIPLGAFFLSSLAGRRPSAFSVPVELENKLDAQIKKENINGQLVTVRRIPGVDGTELKIILSASKIPSASLAGQLAEVASAELKTNVKVNLKVEFVFQAEAKDKE